MNCLVKCVLYKVVFIEQLGPKFFLQCNKYQTNKKIRSTQFWNYSTTIFAFAKKYGVTISSSLVVNPSVLPPRKVNPTHRYIHVLTIMCTYNANIHGMIALWRSPTSRLAGVNMPLGTIAPQTIQPHTPLTRSKFPRHCCSTIIKANLVAYCLWKLSVVILLSEAYRTPFLSEVDF